MATGEIFNTSVAWLGMEHVERRIRSKYGTEADVLLHRLRDREVSRHRTTNLMVATIPRGKDLFQRNLRALEYIASGGAKADRQTVKQLYSDALDDLGGMYPPGVKGGDVDFHEVWKHVLDAARDDAERKAA